MRFWGWTENKREEEKDFAELSARAKAGLPLYGSSDQPGWVQTAAYRNSAFSQLKFRAYLPCSYSLYTKPIALPHSLRRGIPHVRSLVMLGCAMTYLY